MYKILAALLVVASLSAPGQISAASLALIVEGHIVQKTAKLLVFQTIHTLYKIKVPEKASKTLFQLEKLSKKGQHRLTADLSLIVSREHKKGVIK